MTEYKTLIEAAARAKDKAYAPYSGFRVGAALLSQDGQIFTGCNVENVSFSATNCAERTAFFKAVSEGITEFSAIAVISDREAYISPCGVCRQVMVEFCKPDFQILMCGASGGFKQMSLAELMPEMFDKQSLDCL